MWFMAIKYTICNKAMKTDIPLARVSDCVPVREIDDISGNYSFVDEGGNYRIKPQYAYNFSSGLDCIN